MLNASPLASVLLGKCVCGFVRVCEGACYKAEMLLPKLDHMSFNRLFFLWPISKESFNYDLFIHPVFVFFFFVCHAGNMAQMHAQHTHTHSHTHSQGVLIARLSRRKPRRRRGRPQKQQHKYSNEHPITPAKSHFCVAHTGAKLRSFDLKPLLTRSRRWVISDRRLRQCLERLLFLSLLLAHTIYLSWRFSQYLVFIKAAKGGQKGEDYKLLIMMAD